MPIPAIVPAIVGAVGALGGGAMQGVGGARNAREAAEAEERQKKEDLKLQRRQMMLGQKNTMRDQNMNAIGMLAQMRQGAMQSHTGRMFQKDLLRVLGGI